jgi:hypothetical protein
MKMKFEIEDDRSGFKVRKSVSSGYRGVEDENDMEKFMSVIGDMVSDEIRLVKDRR